MSRNPISFVVLPGLSIAIAIAAACSSSPSSATGPAKPAPKATATAKLTPPPSARGTITSADLKAHVELLASDAYGGRRTLADGGNKAADYLASQFKSFGLRPLPGQSGFKVPYTLHRFKFSADGNRLSILGGKALRKQTIGVDFIPFNFSDSGSVANAAVVFAGYGITAKDAGWDDYAGLNVRGKVVLVFRHWPREKDKESKLAGTRHGLFTAKAELAKKNGAVGMLLVTDPLHHKPAEDDLTDSGFLRLPPEDGDTKPDTPAKKATKNPLLAAHISQDTAQMLVATRRGNKSTIRSLREIQNELDAGKLKPKNVRLTAKASITIEAARKPVPVQPDNVIGYLEGSDPVLKDQLVVVGGHYDHLGTAPSGDGDVIYNGADDNASGTAGVLELAQAFASLQVAPRRSLVFVGFSGEEMGLLGSFALMAEEQLAANSIAFMLNLDMIGRNPDKPIEILGEAYAAGIKEAVDAANSDIGLKLKWRGTNYAGNSDHHAFYRKDIPMMFFFTGLHKDYHQLSDHSDKVEFERMEKIVRVGYGVIERIAAADQAPAFIHNLGWLGARIEVLGSGSSEAATLTNVEEDSRGKKAGLSQGDVVLGIDSKPLEHPKQVGKRFRDVEPGATITLQINRGGKAIDVSVVRAKRGFLGIFPGDVKEELRKKHGLGDEEGLTIRGLTTDGPAEKAGIKKDDILFRIGGSPVGPGNLGKELSRIGAGEKVQIRVIRGDERLDLIMVLGERK